MNPRPSDKHCFTCGAPFKDTHEGRAKHLLDHYSRISNEDSKCVFCLRYIITERAAKMHIKREHGEFLDKKLGPQIEF